MSLPMTSRGANVKMLLRDIVANAKRCGRIVKNVLRFARQEPAERWPDDVNSVVQHAIELTQTYASAGGIVETQLGDELPKVMLNPVELEQVFVNLICNGIESADASPSIIITTEQVGSAVRVIVRDNGRGVSRDDRSRIFDPFYTTAPGRRRDRPGAEPGLRHRDRSRRHDSCRKRCRPRHTNDRRATGLLRGIVGRIDVKPRQNVVDHRRQHHAGQYQKDHAGE